MLPQVSESLVPEVEDVEDDDVYARFAAMVARRQLASWLAEQSGPVLDLTPGSPCVEAASPGVPVLALHHNLTDIPCGAAGGIRADDTQLDCLRPEFAGAVVAEQGALADCLVVEDTLQGVRRILRPGGAVLLCVDSLVHGMAALAAAERWAELADSPQADVVIVGNEIEGLSRCFSPAELAACVSEAGLELDWVRPRTVLAPDTISRAVATNPTAMGTLVAAELRLAVERSGDAVGQHLLVSAHRA